MELKSEKIKEIEQEWKDLKEPIVYDRRKKEYIHYLQAQESLKEKLQIAGQEALTILLPFDMRYLKSGYIAVHLDEGVLVIKVPIVIKTYLSGYRDEKYVQIFTEKDNTETIEDFCTFIRTKATMQHESEVREQKELSIISATRVLVQERPTSEYTDWNNKEKVRSFKLEFGEDNWNRHLNIDINRNGEGKGILKVDIRFASEDPQVLASFYDALVSLAKKNGITYK